MLEPVRILCKISVTFRESSDPNRSLRITNPNLNPNPDLFSLRGLDEWMGVDSYYGCCAPHDCAVRSVIDLLNDTVGVINFVLARFSRCSIFFRLILEPIT